MRPAKHPHQDSPTDSQLLEVLSGRPEALRDLYLQLHHLVLDTLPDVNASLDLVDGMTGYGAHQYGYGGWGMAALSAHAKWVRLVFMRATELDDATGILEGTGKNMRHVKVRSAEEFTERAAAIRSLLVQVSRLG